MKGNHDARNRRSKVLICALLPTLRINKLQTTVKLFMALYNDYCTMVDVERDFFFAIQVLINHQSNISVNHLYQAFITTLLFLQGQMHCKRILLCKKASTGFDFYVNDSITLVNKKKIRFML